MCVGTFLRKRICHHLSKSFSVPKKIRVKRWDGMAWDEVTWDEMRWGGTGRDERRWTEVVLFCFIPNYFVSLRIILFHSEQAFFIQGPNVFFTEWVCFSFWRDFNGIFGVGGARFFLNVLGFCGLLVLFPASTFVYACMCYCLRCFGGKNMDVIALKIS